MAKTKKNKVGAMSGDPLRDLLGYAARSTRGVIGKRRARALEKLVDPFIFLIEVAVIAHETIGRPEFREAVKRRWSHLYAKDKTVHRATSASH